MRDGEMRSEAIAEHDDAVETEPRVEVDVGGRGPEEFDISGPPSPERTPARRRMHQNNGKDSPFKRLVVDGENNTDSDDGEVVDGTTENADVHFDDDSGEGGASASGAGGDGNNDAMVECPLH